jgi:hypothetical protein
MAKRCGFLSGFPDIGHLPQQKVKIPTSYGKSPSRSANVIKLRISHAQKSAHHLLKM